MVDGYFQIENNLASAVNRRAQTVSEGTSSKRGSFVTAPTMTAIFPVLSFIYLTSLDNDKGGLLILDIHSLFNITSANLDSVRRERNLLNIE
jgi:hypothetical protein